MAVELSETAYEFAKSPVADGKVVLDERDDWSEHQPSADDPPGHAMRKPVLILATLASAVLAVQTDPVAAARSPLCTRGQTTVERDPRGLLPLTDPNPIGAATTAALRYEKRASRPQVRAATFAIADKERGPQARYSCGVRAWQRTVVVYILDRASLPAQSASQRVYFVGRFSSGYRVWQVVH